MSITVENLSFSYNEIPVLKNVSFSASDGELLAVLGPNGVGKSTLFKCILGLLSGYSGKAYINGQDCAKLSSRQLSQLIAYIPQSHYPSFNYSMLDMVLMGVTSQLGTFSSPGKEHIKQAEEAMEQLGILHLKNRGYTQVSGGERQLALIARAITQKAKVLIMDEPASNLDYGNQMRVIQEVKRLTADGYTIIESTHNPDQAFMSADRILAIHNGTVIADGMPTNVINSELIKKLYGVDVDILSAANDKIRFCVPTSILDITTP